MSDWLSAGAIFFAMVENAFTFILNLLKFQRIRRPLRYVSLLWPMPPRYRDATLCGDGQCVGGKSRNVGDAQICAEYLMGTIVRYLCCAQKLAAPNASTVSNR